MTPDMLITATALGLRFLRFGLDAKKMIDVSDEKEARELLARAGVKWSEAEQRFDDAHGN